jgi:hypothetical protein
MRPLSANDEAGHLPAAKFRSLLAQLIGAPTAVSATSTKAYAPKTKKKRRG